MAECSRHGRWEPPELAYPLETEACGECRKEATRAAQAYGVSWYRFQHWEHSSGIEIDEKSAFFENYVPVTESQAEAKELMHHYSRAVIDRGKGGVYLYGPEGAGKTHLSAAVLTAAIQEGVLGHINNWPDLKNSLWASFRARTECSDYEIALSSPLLVLDRLSSSRWDQWEIEKFEHLVDFRYRRCLPTIWIADCEPSSLKAITQKIESRFSSRAAPVKVDGPDHRKSDKCFDRHPPAFTQPELPTIRISYPKHTQTLSESEILWYSRLK